MNCSQVLPGAVNPGSCSVATGYLDEFPFICYASGSNLIILDGKLHHLQTILGTNFGYTDTQITCMHVAELTGKVVAAWGCDVIIFNPEQSDITSSGKFQWSWKQCYTHTYQSKVLSLSFSRTGLQLLVGGKFISMCSHDNESDGLLAPDSSRKVNESNENRIWKEVFNTKVASPVAHLKFSPDGMMFASAAQNDRLVKIWFKSTKDSKDKKSPQKKTPIERVAVKYSFTFITHPRAVTGLVWRKTSVYMRRHAIPNVLLTRCKDNTCRIWSHIVPHEKAPQSNLLRFFLAATIDPIADIPFRSTMPVEDAPFIVHWLNNKEMTFTNKVDRIYRSPQSLQSLSSSANEEMLASWVCVEEKTSPDPEGICEYQTFDIGEYAPPDSPKSFNQQRDVNYVLDKKKERQLIEEWINSPDLLVCIHPNNGSLMVWTMEGLDTPKHSTKLVHISFSSCLPHVLPPHLAQTLYQELQQYILADKQDPEITKPCGLASSNLNASVMSLPVPQMRLPMGKRSAIPYIPDSRKQLKTDSSLILLSSHCNGSLNAWSVELTVQANYCTSIAGLIHCGVTGGHSKEIQSVHRHPWLPVLMTVAHQKMSSRVENELIIWNANLAGPLDQKSQIRELSRVTSLEPKSFQYATWVPPIAIANTSMGALSRCPSFGLFISNVGNELCLFQTSLYPIIPPNSTHTNYYDSCPLYTGSSKEITVFSHSGSNGMSFINLIEENLDEYENIIALHAFRMDSAVVQANPSGSDTTDLSDELLIVLIENRQFESSIQIGSQTSSGASSCRSYLHVWRVILSKEEITPHINRSNSLDPWYQPSSLPTLICRATVKKIINQPFPILNTNSYIVSSNPSCDIASSLQLQLPSLTSPYLFNTVCSDGQIFCWQFHVFLLQSVMQYTNGNSKSTRHDIELVVYDVFGGSSIMKGPMKVLNCAIEEVLHGLPLQSYIPCSMTAAYPGRFAMAHLLTKPLASTTSTNPLDQHAMVSMWECESSGGLQWVCESVLPLHGIGGVANSSKGQEHLVHMDWLPMENGAYLLATCFNSVISIFGMALPVEERHIAKQPDGMFSRRFSKSVITPVLTSHKASSAWVNLLHFPCSKPFTRLPTLWLAYTGSNSLMVGMGCEIHVYSCWVSKEWLSTFSQQKPTVKINNRTLHKHSRLASRLASKDFVNLLDYAHSKNSPLPQYHPKILTDLLNAGKLDAVKMILTNLLKYLSLYQQTKTVRTNNFRTFEEIIEEEHADETDSRTRLLSMVDGSLTRSKKAVLKVEVEHVPPVSLSQLKIFTHTMFDDNEQLNVGGDTVAKDDDNDSYNALFADNVQSYDSDFLLDEVKENDALCFDKISLEETTFDPDMADRLTSILFYARLPDVDDVEQVRLLAIAQTVARNKMTFGDHITYSTLTGNEMVDLGTSGGAGYAASGFVPGGIGGGEAMDDCGLRYLLALQNYITLSASLPKDVVTEGLPPSDMIWAFHSDAEMELLSSIPCVQDDKLEWAELKNAGIGWWVRSNDTLRKLIEKLAKAQFMKTKDPLNASLFYIAMKKQSLLKGLFKTVSDDKMTKFFSNDFTQDRWRKAALKNAFALLSKQRFEHAAAFFLLVGELWDTVEVCINRLHDLQLALVVIRLYEGDNGPNYNRLLKENVLGISQRGSLPTEPNPDPFLRSMSLWLLQDYSGSLETLIVDLKPGLEDGSKSSNTTIFNFYFYLRSHPLLIRRIHPVKKGHSIQPSTSIMDFTSKFHGQSLSGVGDEPLTPTERNLVFTTAYHHLNSGSPLLALTVLSKLPKSEDLGQTDDPTSSLPSRSNSIPQRSVSFDAVMSGLITSGNLITGTERDSQTVSFSISEDSTDYIKPLGAIPEEDDDDWSKPVSMQVPAEEDEFDWSKPVSQLAVEDDDFDWSKPVSSHLQLSDEEEQIKQNEETTENELVQPVLNKDEQDKNKMAISPRGLFIISLAEQLQYNALLSILTEELITIHIPSCCKYLWESRGKEALPLLPLSSNSSDFKSMVEWFEDEAFEHSLVSLQVTLIEWLRSETQIVKEVCNMEISDGSSMAVKQASHAGYDLLTTLLNYTILHAGTIPSMLAVKTELMHLMNTLLPWSTGLAQEMEDTDTDIHVGHVASCAINPAQLPILTSCSLPAKHPLNLSLHMKLLSASIFDSISNHSCPPNIHSPLVQRDRVFELCMSLSHCVSLCLAPMRLNTRGLLSRNNVLNNSGTSSSSPSTKRQRQGSGSETSDVLSSFETPKSRPSKWPGLPHWPNSLLSDDGKEASPLCLILMEALIVLYTGLITVAWSKHSIYDLLILLANIPSQDKWPKLFGGGVTESKKNPSSLIKKMRRQDKKGAGLKEGSGGLYVAPKKSLLKHCLTKPTKSVAGIHFEKEPDDEFSEDEDNFEETEEDVWLTGHQEDDPNEPRSYSWCLMNLGIVKMISKILRNTVSLAGMEALEFITASPVLYKLLALFEDWETHFTNQLQAHPSGPPVLFQPGEREQAGYGPALTRHKFILEPEHSPFREDNKPSRLAQRLWSYLVHQEDVRELFINYIFYHKRIGAVIDEPPIQRILYRQPDSPVSCLCINSSNGSVFALATSKEVLEIEVPDILSLDIMPNGPEEGTPDSHNSLKRLSLTPASLRGSHDSTEFIMIQNAGSTRRASAFSGIHAQTGSTSSILLKRNVSSIRKMAAHPTLAYYLTGSADGSVKMFEFNTPKPVSVLRQAGSGPGITQIRFTQQGNKYGVTDISGKLSLWQGIQTCSKGPYQTLNPSTNKCIISDFAFLGSSSRLATCGESAENKNIMIWDTLMPSRNNIVKEYTCHESGASAIAFSSTRQRLISGGRRGDLSIFDIRQHKPMTNIVVHSAAITRIVLNDAEGYFITGSQDGEIKVWDLMTVTEITAIAGRHYKSRLFRAESGVMDMVVDQFGCLYSCGADGTVKVHTLELPNSV